MLSIQSLSKSYGERRLFEGVNLAMSPAERLGLIGRNGSGKTTLFRLILGEEHADEGKIELPRNYRVGHLSQLITFNKPTVLEEAASGLPVHEGDWIETHRAEKALMGLGFEITDFDRPPQTMSGGFQVRLQLARLLLSEPNLLLLDEPTNYLDIVSVRWLERFLRAWPNELILITHDQDFMNQVTTHTMILHRGSARRIRGPTTQLYEMISQEEEIYEKTRLNEAKARRQQERFIERFRAKASKASVVQSRIKLLAKHVVKQELESIQELEFSFNSAPFTGQSMIAVEDLGFGYADEAPLIRDLTLAVHKGDRLAIIGKNGKGKTTLLNLLARSFEPRRGSVRHHTNLRMAHFGQGEIEKLDDGKTVEEEIISVHPDRDRRSSRAICGAMMFDGDDAMKRVRMLSGGERARVLLGKLLVTPANLLLLDEPTNHLDMDAIDSLIEAMAAFEGGVVLVTHNERVLFALATRLVVFDRGKVSVFESTYQDFLDRVGWSDEKEAKAIAAAAKESAQKGSTGAPASTAAGAKDAAARKESGAGRKESRRERAEMVARRAKALKPLETKVKALEEKIIGDEACAQVLNDELLAASTSADGKAIARLSRELQAVKRSIDEDFESLASAGEELARKRAEFEEDAE